MSGFPFLVIVMAYGVRIYVLDFVDGVDGSFVNNCRV